ncbi:unnamed protein product [Albugo candida]|uniref:Uncharacterized protein n=1 Tax=Albugo candida TaxID=65357 RepID=A0A024GV34_9STRA|nr:unnamed protein product [Albugo candida]|eukprot:CCI50239.1 unnamed protein product [Albugo candida]
MTLKLVKCKARDIGSRPRHSKMWRLERLHEREMMLVDRRGLMAKTPQWILHFFGQTGSQFLKKYQITTIFVHQCHSMEWGYRWRDRRYSISVFQESIGNPFRNDINECIGWVPTFIAYIRKYPANLTEQTESVINMSRRAFHSYCQTRQATTSCKMKGSKRS